MKSQAAVSIPICPADTPDLAGLFFYGFHSTFHGAEQRLDLIGCLLQKEAGHKLIHVAPTFIHLGASGENLDVGRQGGLGHHLGLMSLLCTVEPCATLEAAEYTKQGPQIQRPKLGLPFHSDHLSNPREQ